jgi:hypothetical protein
MASSDCTTCSAHYPGESVPVGSGAATTSGDASRGEDSGGDHDAVVCCARSSPEFPVGGGADPKVGELIDCDRSGT